MLVDMINFKIYGHNDVITKKGDRGRSCFFIMYKGTAVTVSVAACFSTPIISILVSVSIDGSCVRLLPFAPPFCL